MKSGSPQRFPTFFCALLRLILMSQHGLNSKLIMNKEDYYRSHASKQNALIRYKTIDRCLRNKYRRWTLDDLVEACSDALYEMECITRGVSVRTVQADIQVMRSDKLGYEAPIEVYDGKFYRYADEDYSISNLPLDSNMCDLISDALGKLRQFENIMPVNELGDVLTKVKHKLEHLLEEA